MRIRDLALFSHSISTFLSFFHKGEDSHIQFGPHFFPLSVITGQDLFQICIQVNYYLVLRHLEIDKGTEKLSHLNILIYIVSRLQMTWQLQESLRKNIITFKSVQDAWVDNIDKGHIARYHSSSSIKYRNHILRKLFPWGCHFSL